MRTLLVVPAFEEENSLADVLAEVKRELPSLDILVIDDGSTDHTAAVARKAGALVCSLPFNLGVGGALRTGFRYAMLNGYDSCVQLDADGQHLPSEVPVLLAGSEFPNRKQKHGGWAKCWAEEPCGEGLD